MNILIAYSLLFSLLDFLGGSVLKKEVLFESLESKTEQGRTVFNKISLVQNQKTDIWKMLQSHNGIKPKKWDEIKIIVTKESKPFSVSFHQLKDGKEVEYKTSCFRCHPNGPRYIRPKLKSKAVLSNKEKAIIFKWNLLIKSYGDMKLKKKSKIKRTLPLIANMKLFKQKLKLESCKGCHSKAGDRSELTQSNISSIKFLVDTKEMPPWPYTISIKDRNMINELAFGF